MKCWKPKLNPPKYIETNYILTESEQAVLRRLHNRYMPALNSFEEHNPLEIAGWSDFEKKSVLKTVKPLVQDVMIKHEQLTPPFNLIKMKKQGSSYQNVVTEQGFSSYFSHVKNNYLLPAKSNFNYEHKQHINQHFSDNPLKSSENYLPDSTLLINSLSCKQSDFLERCNHSPKPVSREMKKKHLFQSKPKPFLVNESKHLVPSSEKANSDSFKSSQATSFSPYSSKCSHYDTTELEENPCLSPVIDHHQKQKQCEQNSVRDRMPSSISKYQKIKHRNISCQSLTPHNLHSLLVSDSKFIEMNQMAFVLKHDGSSTNSHISASGTDLKKTCLSSSEKFECAVVQRDNLDRNIKENVHTISCDTKSPDLRLQESTFLRDKIHNDHSSGNLCLPDASKRKNSTFTKKQCKQGSVDIFEGTSKESFQNLSNFSPEICRQHDISDGKVPNDRVLDVSSFNDEKREKLLVQMQNWTQVSMLVLYDDGSTNSDASLFFKPMTQSVQGVLLYGNGITYIMPLVCKETVQQWIRSALQAILEKKTLVKIAINCKHLIIAFLKDFGLVKSKAMLEWHFEDPIIAGWLLKPDNPPYTLQALCKVFDIGLSPQFSCPDSDSPCKKTYLEMTTSVSMIKHLRVKLRNQGLWPLFYHLEMPLVPILADMELQTIRVNTEAFLSFSDIIKKKLHKLEQRAYELVGHKFCINSTQQIRQVLYEELRLDKQLPIHSKVSLTATAHHKSTSEPMLQQLTHLHPLPKVILEHRHMLKLKSTYIDGILESLKHGELQTHWDQIAAATGRLTSCLPNLQAIPKIPTIISDFEISCIIGHEMKSITIYAREPYISNEGHVFLAADFQQIELRILAHLTDDPKLKSIFCSDHVSDVFVQLAAQWLSKPEDDVTKSEREQTKRVVYSILYGVGKDRLAEYLKVTPSTAKDIMDSFLVSFPTIQTFTKTCISYAKQYGYTKTIMGRRRWVQNVHHQSRNIRSQAERQAVNFCVQGSAADLCKCAMVRVEEALRQKTHLKARLLLQIHDELLWELPKDELQETCKLIREVMENGVLLCEPLLAGLRIPTTITLTSGTSWAHLQPCD